MSPPLSRRRFLSVYATGGFVSLTGCSTIDRSDESVDGVVWQKKVQVELTQTEGSVLTDILRLQFDRDRDEVFGVFDPEYVDGAINDASVAVSSELHDTLTTEFDRVNYKIKLGPVNDAGDHVHAQAHRTAFNELPLAGHASVEKFWVEETDDLRVGYVRPKETEPPSQPPSTCDISRFNLGANYDRY
ncbi:hypothetical protein DJ74_07015 [Halorubrum sp. Ea8]|nr:hypothetical protein DJ74_07015 [Halorubrum sp. Ea8]